MNAVLDVEGLSVALRTRGGAVEALDRLNLSIQPGETVCLVGESGSGKTVSALSMTRLIDYKGGRITHGAVWLARHNLATLTQRQMSVLRGRRIGLVFQEPMTAFDPLFSIGAQIGEVLIRHRKLGSAAARREAIELLRRVKITDPERRVDQYPHQLSGGMRQRAMIAIALACGPKLLIADEPTTALDVTIQAQILALLKSIQVETGMAMLLITHDLGVAASVADRVVVMYAGRIVEEAPARTLFANPRHPYTRGLLRSVIGHDQARNTPLYSIDGSVPDLAHLPAECRFRPRCPRAAARCATERPPLERLGESLVACWRPDPAPLDADPGRPSATMIKLRTAEAPPLAWASDVKKDYPLGGGWLGRGRGAIRAVDGVSLEVRTGETLGLVGESGSGKSTLGRLLLGLEHPTSGRIAVEGQDLAALDTEGLRAQRRHMQMIFQDPYGSLDPRWTIGDSVAEPLRIYESLSRAERRTRVQDLLEQVGLDARWEGRFPHQLSGGQRQRVAIARAIALNPRFVVADEAVSALDVSVRAQIINLLETVKARLGLTYLFIGHELNLVRHVSDRVAVMYLGRLVEIGLADEVLRRPAHHYTRALIAAIPQLDTTRAEAPVPVDGEIPSAGVVARGCGFASRCAAATVVCHAEAPELLTVAAEHAAACHHPL